MLNARHRIWKAAFPQIKIDVLGYNVWLPLPEPLTGYQFAQLLLENGVRVKEAEMFVVGRAVRVSLLSPLSRPQLQSALNIMKNCMSRATE